MAKIEQDPNTEKVKKSKGKKRQHPVDKEEEIAQKIFVAAPASDDDPTEGEHVKAVKNSQNSSADVQAEAMDVSTTKKPKKNNVMDVATHKTATKRKSLNEKSGINEKRLRPSQSEDENDEDDAGVSMASLENDMPTASELDAAEKIRNETAKETIRQKKKKKHEQRIIEQKNCNADKEKQRIEEYLEKWKYKQAEWKFEKLRQISIQQNIFDDKKISDEFWPIALEYLSSSKGAAKKTILDLANEVIVSLDRECNEKTEDPESREQIVNSTKYQRARDLLQNLD